MRGHFWLIPKDIRQTASQMPRDGRHSMFRVPGAASWCLRLTSSRCGNVTGNVSLEAGRKRREIHPLNVASKLQLSLAGLNPTSHVFPSPALSLKTAPSTKIIGVVQQQLACTIGHQRLGASLLKWRSTDLMYDLSSPRRIFRYLGAVGMSL